MLDFASLLNDRNVRAFLRVIREGESSQTDDAYRMRYPGKRFDDLSKHPRIFERTPTGQQSSAAGAYQFTATTWDRINAKYGLADDFKPYSQDCHAVALVHDVGALDLVIDGDLYAAVRLCGKVWSSLPDAVLDDGHGFHVEWARAKAVWDKYGGGVPHVVASTAPIEDRGIPARPEDIERINHPEGESMPFPAIIAAVLPALMQALPELMKLFGKDDPKDQARLAAATKVVDIVTRATGSVNAQEAVEKITADPVAKEQARTAVQQEWYTLVGEGGGGGIAGARAYAVDPTAMPFWKQGAFVISMFLLAIGGAIVGSVLFAQSGVWRPEDRSQILTLAPVLFAGVMGFWLGTSWGSQRKDELAKR